MKTARLKKEPANSRKNLRSLDQFVGQRLKTIRTLKNMSQKELIHLAQLTTKQQVFSKYEKGSIRIPATVLFSLAQALEVDIGTFFPVANAKNKVSQDNDILERMLSNSLQKLKKIENECADEVATLETLLRKIDAKA